MKEELSETRAQNYKIMHLYGFEFGFGTRLASVRANEQGTTYDRSDTQEMDENMQCRDKIYES